MRTKTLALSAVIGMLGTASVLAQNVYSINAVGYINLTILPGYNIITCPLVCSPDNTLNTVFANAGPNYPFQNSTVLQFSGGTYTASDSGLGSYAGGGWANGGADVTLNPGQAVFVFNNNNTPNAGNVGAINVTFVGSVPQGTLATTLIPGYNLVGSQVPYSGDLAINAGVSPNNFPNLNVTPALNDFLLLFNPAHSTGVNQVGYSASYEGGSYSPGWQTDPVNTSTTQGFFYYNNAASRSSSANETWTEVFSINP